MLDKRSVKWNIYDISVKWNIFQIVYICQVEYQSNVKPISWNIYLSGGISFELNISEMEYLSLGISVI